MRKVRGKLKTLDTTLFCEKNKKKINNNYFFVDKDDFDFSIKEIAT